MSRLLHLGPGLELPLTLATQATAIFGIRGSGKTNTAGVIAEELLRAGQPIAVIDPTDAWWGLRSIFPVVTFGGSHAQIPLTENDAKAIAEFVAHDQLPVILSLRHLRKAEQRRLVTVFCTELFHLKGKTEHRSPLTVFIDEAPLFAPQRVMGETATVVGAIEDLVARGRNSGFGVVLISQRPATLNADVRSLCDAIITHRITGPLDRKAFRAWIEENATVEEIDRVLESLAKLKDGEAWVWAPSIDVFQRTKIRMRESYDSSRTPKPGEKLRPPKKLEEVDLEQLKGRLAATIARAKADDPRELRKRIAELEREVAKKAPPAPAIQKIPKLTKVEVPILAPKAVRELERLVSVTEALVARAKALHEEHVKFAAGFPVWKTESAPHLSAPAPAMRNPPTVAGLARRSTPALMNGRDPEVGRGGLSRMLTALAQRPVGLSAEQLGIRAGMSSRSGTFDTYLGRGRRAGWIDGTRGRLKITDAGLAALGEFDPLPTGPGLLEHWLGDLGTSGMSRMLRALADVYPGSLSAEQLGAAADISDRSGTFDTYLGRLRRLELVEGARGALIASAELFE